MEDAVLKCLVHSPKWRSQFQYIINHMRVTSNLGKEHAGHINGIVCTCRKLERPDQEWNDISDEHFQQACSTVGENLKKTTLPDQTRHLNRNNESEIFAKTLLALLKKCDSLERAHLSTHGLKKLVVVLAQIYNNQLQAFENLNRRCLAKVQILPSQDFDVYLNPCYTGLLVGKCGSRIKAISQKSGCVIKLPKRGRIRNSLKSVFVELKGSRESAESAKFLLQAAADEISLKRQKHEAWVREYSAVRDKVRMSYLLRKGKELYPRGIAEDIKNWNRADYERKKSGHKKFNHGNNPKVKGHVLLASGSRCLNCLTPFDSEAFKSESCRYHPGFVAKTQWSCCGLRAESQHASYVEHKSTGCSVSVHNWRPHQKRSGKNSLNSAMESKCSLSEEGRQTRQDLRL